MYNIYINKLYIVRKIFIFHQYITHSLQVKGESSLRKTNANIVKISEIIDFIAKDLFEVPK